MSRLRRCIIGALALFSFAVCSGAGAQPYPSQRITFVVAFAPGGVADTLARIIAKGVEQRLGQSVVVENRPGAGGNVAAGVVSRATAEAVQRLNLAPVPTVALIQGGCFGGGTGIAAACDVVIAADNAMFSIAEVRWGLTAAIIVPQLNDAIGVRQLRRYGLTGERFNAEEARRIGLVHEVVPLAELSAAGERVIGHVLENAPDAIGQTKALTLKQAFGDLSDAAFAALIESHAAKRQSAEATEGLASFAEKRAAKWASRKI